jgi:hypothetical protein
MPIVTVSHKNPDETVQTIRFKKSLTSSSIMLIQEEFFYGCKISQAPIKLHFVRAKWLRQRLLSFN